MKLYDGSGKYVRLADLTLGDTVRCRDRQSRVVASVDRDGQLVHFGCIGGYSGDGPAESRIIRRAEHSPAGGVSV
jgi:hypothetical protein